MTTTIKVHFDGHVLVPEEPIDLPIGQSMKVRVESGDTVHAEVGSPAAVLRAVLLPPHLEAADVAELKRGIDDAALPVRPGGIFDQQSGK